MLASPAAKGRLRLARMIAVDLQIQQIIEHIDRGGRQAESQHREQRRAQCREVARTVAGQQGHENQQVFGPLVRAYGVRQSAPSRCLRGDRTSSRNNPRMHVLPHGRVPVLIAAIVEAAIAKELDQPLRFGAAREEMPLLTGQDACEQAQMARNLRREPFVGGRAQPQVPAARPLAPQPIQQRHVVRQRRRIEFDARGNFGLQCRPASQQPNRQHEQQ